jgi:hypothetical protein
MNRVLPVLGLFALVSSASAGWLSPMQPRGRLSVPVSCYAAPDHHELKLERGTLVNEINLVSEPRHNTPMYVVDVLSGRYRAWRCVIESPGHEPLTIDESQKR